MWKMSLFNLSVMYYTLITVFDKLESLVLFGVWGLLSKADSQ